VGQPLMERIVSVLHAGAGLGDEFGEMAAADREAENIADEFANGGKGTMAAALEVGDQGVEAWPDQTGAALGCVDGRVVNLLAFAAPARLTAKLDDANQFGGFEQIDLLNDLGRQLAGHDGAMTIGARVVV